MSKIHTWPVDVKLFLVDTAEMTNEEVGIFIRLLCYQWENGSVDGHPNRVPIRLPINQASGEPYLPPFVLRKFEQDQDGRLTNQRLEETRQEVLKRIDKLSVSGKNGAEKRWGTDAKANREANGQANGEANGEVNGEANGSQSQSQSQIYLKDTIVSIVPPSLESYKAWGLKKENTQEEADLYWKITKEFYKLIETNLTDLNISTKHLPRARVSTWLAPVRLMIESDGFSPNDIREAYKVVKNDKFWRKVIQSTDSLRSSMAKLLTQSRSDGTTRRPNSAVSTPVYESWEDFRKREYSAEERGESEDLNAKAS